MNQYEKRWRAFLLNLWNNQKKAKTKMRDDCGGRCCLCVMEDTGAAFGFKKFQNKNNEFFPDIALGDFFACRDRSRDIFDFCPIFQGDASFSLINDGNSEYGELTHKEIAILFCDLYPGLDDLKAYFRKRIKEFVPSPHPICFEYKIYED